MTDDLPDEPLLEEVPPGLARVRRLEGGDVPFPGMWTTVGMRPCDIERGTATIEVVTGNRHANGHGVAHGGLVASIADTAAGTAMATVLDHAERVSTVDLKVDYHRAVPLGTTVSAVGTVRHRGRTMGQVDVEVTADDKVVATARAMFAILPREDASGFA